MMHPFYRHTLLHASLHAFRRYRIARRVSRYREEKATKHFSNRLKSMAFAIVLKASDTSKEERAVQLKLLKTSSTFRADSLLLRAIKSWKLISYRARVLRYFKHRSLIKHGSLFFDRLRERFFEIRTERVINQRAIRLRQTVLVSKVLKSFNLKARRNRRKRNATKAIQQHKTRQVFHALRKYSHQRKQKQNQYKAAFDARSRAITSRALVKCVQVGMYWLGIKGRFGTSRTYLQMKYGYRWLYRTRLRKLLKPHQTIEHSQQSVHKV
jgi:Holliday junction resolvase-like predicted endonuclease